MTEDKTIPVPGRNLGDYIREAAIVGGILAGIAATAIHDEPDEPNRPIVIKNPSKGYAEAMLADRIRAGRHR